MPDLPTIAGGPSETGADAANAAGVALNAAASTNTKASTWTEVIATTSYASNWLLVMFAGVTGAAFLVDIGVGASTAEQVLIANLYAHAPAAGSPLTRAFLFPLRVPAGTRISGRCQSATGSGTIHVAVAAIGTPIGAPPGLTRVETCGADTSDSNGVSVDCGATPNTDVIGELIASTGFSYKWMCVSVGNPTDTAWGAYTQFIVDICVGAAGSEVPVIQDIRVAGSTTDDRPNPGSICFPVAINAGSRVSARVQCNVATAGERVLDLVGYGVG